MDLGYVDKVGKDNNSVKYLLVRQTCLIEPQMQKERNQTIPRKRFVHFYLSIQKQITRERLAPQGTEFVGEFQKLSKAEGIQSYSTRV